MPPTVPPENEFAPAPAARRLSAEQRGALVDATAGLMVARQLLEPPPSAEERAAWAADASRVATELGPRPRGDCSPARWKRFLDDVRKFVEDGWLHRARKLGWDGSEIFGVDRRKPWGRTGRMGLALLIGGGQVTALDGKDAVIERSSGALPTYRRALLDPDHVVSIDEIEVG